MLPDPSRVPSVLRDRAQWVNWAWVERDGKLTKPPYCSRTFELASTTDPTTWSTLAMALRAAQEHPQRFAGIGFVLGPDRSVVGLDLDHCRDEAGEIAPWALAIVERCRSYTEITPSGRGLRIFLLGQLPPGRRRRGQVECYDSARYLTVTGNHLPGTPTEIRACSPEEMAALHADFLGGPEVEAPAARGPAAAPVSLDDQEVVERMLRSREGARIGRLMAGDSSDHGGDESAADLALANYLVFWTGGDVAQADRIFRNSGRMREKWDRRHSADGRTYGQMTLDRAMEGRTAFYRGGGGSENGCGQPAPEAGGEFDGIRPGVAAQIEKRPELPTIHVNGRHLREISADALAALKAWNQPARLFLRAGRLVRVLADERGRPAIQDVSEHCLRGALCRAANFARTEVRGRGEGKTAIDVIVHPPMEVVRDILALGEWEVPPLEGIIESPVIRPDGTVLTAPGYDAATRLYYHRDGLRLADVPEEPSAVDVELAKQALLDLVCDFPFVDEASRTNWLGLLLTPILRPAIDGPVPIALIDAPMAGTGKSLLAEVVSIVATGASAEMLPQPKDDDEMRKKITGLLTKGAGMICFDNVTSEIASPDLALALTGRLWSDRALGGNQIITVPQRATWMATGNNLRVAGDMGRRSYWIRMDAMLSDPEQRSQFRHANLTEYAKSQRGYLLACALTIARNWFARGRPKADVPRMGSFESWCEVIGGVLHACGMTQFLGNLKEMRANADEERGEWEAFLRAWYALYGSAAKPLSEVISDLNAGGDLRATLPLRLTEKLGHSGFSRSFGKALSARQGTRYGADNIRLEKGGGDLHNKVTTWKVVV